MTASTCCNLLHSYYVESIRFHLAIVYVSLIGLLYFIYEHLLESLTHDYESIYI